LPLIAAPQPFAELLGVVASHGQLDEKAQGWRARSPQFLTFHERTSVVVKSVHNSVELFPSGGDMKRIDLLKQISFGVQVAEDEVNEIASYFVETNQWAKVAKGEIDIIRGEKGSGKSAIYSLLMTKVDTFFDQGLLLVAAENPRGATVFKDLVADPPTTENEFIALWKLYALALIAQQLREYEVRGPKAEKVYAALEGAQLLEREFSLRGLLRSAHKYARRIVAAEQIEGGLTLDPVTQMPTGVTGKIVLKEPSAELKAKGVASIETLFATLNEVLEAEKLKVWILLDRLDVAFVDNHELEANALRALIRAYADIRNLGQVSLKIFLREDIWKRITEQGLREASHLIRYVILDWPQPNLLNLIMRRLLKNEALVKELQIDAAAILQDTAAQEELFYRAFPKQVEQGPQKAPTFKWLITRCADGTGKTAPREVIHLLNCILDEEIKRLENGGVPAPDHQLFDRSVFKTALPTVSGARLNQYLYAEYPSERPFIAKLEGQKAEQTPDSLADLWALPRDRAISKAKTLVDLGFFEERGTRDEPTFWVPFLYRDALNLVQGKADADD
jgi:hypothetical protein